MQEKNSDPGQSARSDQPSRQQMEGNENKRGAHVRLTPARVLCGALVLAVLVCSLIFALAGAARISFARSNSPAAPQDTTTPTPTPTDTSTPTPTSTPTQTSTPTPTPTPKKNPTPVPTQAPVIPPAATATATATATASPTATATTPVASPTAATTATTGVPTSPGNTNGTSTSSKSGGSGMSVVMIIVGIVLLLLLCLGVGWLMFRRMLLPGAEVKLPPSGARPWSRTRAPSPDGQGGAGGMNMEQFNRNAAAAFGAPSNGNMPSPNGFEQFGNGVVPPNNGFAPNMQGFDGPQMNFPGPASNGYAPQGNGYGGFSDGFIPPSPQIFPQSEASMIPPGSGAFPVINNNNGFAPASSAFNAMYGLPDDPFSPSQPGSSPWLDNLGNGNGNGPGMQRPPSGPGFAPGAPDLNDPHLAEVIRQYSQKGQAVKPQPPQNGPQNGFQNPGWLQ